MTFIKDLPVCNYMTGNFAIYELSATEQEMSMKMYLVNKKYSQYALEKMDAADLIKTAIKESEYVYGTGFGDTIAECELLFKCHCLEVAIMSMQNAFRKIREISSNITEL